MVFSNDLYYALVFFRNFLIFHYATWTVLSPWVKMESYKENQKKLLGS